MIEPQERELLELVNAFEKKLSESDIASIKELINAREWGIGFENLCTQLYEFEIPIPTEVYRRIKAIGQYMKIDRNYYTQLESHQSSASINTRSTSDHG